MSHVAPLVDCHNHLGVELGAYLRGHYPYAQSVPQLLIEGDAAAISHFLVFPMVTNLALNLDGMRAGEVRTDGAAEKVPYVWENRRLLDEIFRFFPAHAARFFPLAMADPLRETDRQAAAITALYEEYLPIVRSVVGPDARPFVGLKFQTTILQAPILALRDEGRVLLDVARQYGLPLLIHSSVLPADRWAQASDIIDLAEENPDVRFCVAHSCRFDRPCLDRIAALPNTVFDCSAHIIHCELASRDFPHVAPEERRFDTDYTDPARALRDLAEAYPDKLLWGSDSPYQSYVDSSLTLWATYADEAACLFALPEPLRRRVAYENAVRWFDLPHSEERLAPHGGVYGG